MRLRLTSTVLALLLGAGCAGAPVTEAGTPSPAATEAGAPSPAATEAAGVTPRPPEPTVTPSGPFPTATVELRPRAGTPTTVAVHVASDPPTRARGLMGRVDVPPGTGMLFLFPEDTDGGFWMKDTLVPLSIAFADGDGRIVRVLDMEPCEADPCTAYRPEVAYRAALEVPRGWFGEVGVGEGDVLALPAELPAAR